MRFILDLFDQEIPDSEYTSPLISALSILGINTDLSWHTALNYTPKLSAIITTSRWLVLYSAVIKRRHLITESEANQNVNFPILTHFLLVKKWTHRLLVLNEFGVSPKPWNWIYKLRTYGLKIRYTESSLGSIIWNGPELHYADISISMSQLRGLIHGLLSTAKAHLLEDILFTKTQDYLDLPAINLSALKDNPVEKTPGFSFLSDVRNRLNSDNWLYTRFISTPDLIQRFISTSDLSSQSLVWNLSELSDYFQQIRQFKSELLVLIHLTSGGPARAPELLSIRYLNTQNGGVRNVFIENGLVSFITGYHKGYLKHKEVKLINRFMPKEVSQLLIYYLYLVIPFERNMEIIHNLKPIQSAFIWPEKPGVNLSNPVFKRQRRFTDLNRNQGINPDNSTQNSQVLGLQTWNYWTPNQISEAIHSAFTTRLRISINISKWRHIYTAIVRQYLKSPDLHGFLKISTENPIAPDYSSQSEDDIADLQASHTSKVAGLTYGRLLLEIPGQIHTKREKFRQISLWMHQFFLLDTVNPTLFPDQTNPIQDIQENYFHRFQQFKSVDIIEKARFYFGFNFKFRANQKAVLRSILSGQNITLNIAATGSGKSFLIILLALISGKNNLSILIVPLLSLKSDLNRRFLEYGINCQDWNSQNPPEAASLVLITPESFQTKTFYTFLNRQKLLGRLDRVYFDECHILLDATAEFRPKILELKALIGLETQLVFFTATLPPKLEQEWFNLLNIIPQNAYIFRDFTARKNIRYSMVKINQLELFLEVKSQIETSLDRFSTGLILIYSGSVKMTQQIAEYLNCPAYFHQSGNYSDKNLIIQHFRAGNPRILVATNALGLGLDLPNIRTIIHIGFMRRLRDYIQESGRAGRDSEYSESVIFYTDSTQSDDQDLMDLITTTQCRRIIIDRVMDGNLGRKSCLKPEVFCDWCDLYQELPDPDASSPNRVTILPNRVRELSPSQSERLEFTALQQEKSENRLKSSIIQEYETLNLPELDRLLRLWRGNCALCYYYQNGSSSDHFLSNCVDNNDQIRTILRDLQTSYRPPSYSGCLNCYLPIQICNRYELTDNGNFERQLGRKCQYYRVVFDVLGVFLSHFQSANYIWIYDRISRYSGLKLGPEATPNELVLGLLQLFPHKIRSFGIESTELVLFFQYILVKFHNNK